MTLRPEWTAPVVRAVLEHNLLANGPQRLYYLGPIFRYERPQAGRYRQSHQFGVECFGFEGPEADVEVISLASDVIGSCGLEVTLSINSIGDEVCRPRYREALFAHFAPHKDALSPDSQRRLERNPLRILDSKAPQDRALVESAPTMLDVLCEPCAAHFARVRHLLDAIGVAYVVDPRIVRGLDYYTRTLFEFTSDALGAQSGIAGGGRYDGLVEMLGGPPTPGVGLAAGIERILLASGAEPELAPAPDLYIAHENARADAFGLAIDARAAGLRAQLELGGRSLKGQLKHAERLNARFVAVLEPESALLRDRDGGAERSVAREEIIGQVLSS